MDLYCNFVVLMKREIITTADGSKTIFIPDWDENYHSKHGALQEALHVFIEAGLIFKQQEKQDLKILEIGFGTGLNAILTAIYTAKENLEVEYHGLEAFPVSAEEIAALDYASLDAIKYNVDTYNKLHNSDWNVLNQIAPSFSLKKIEQTLEKFTPTKNSFDIIYFDAFGPRVQNEMWSLPIFEKLFNSLKENGILVTYCAKGQVKRDLKTAGFTVESIPGPPGKREMTRGKKGE